ncbi:MAG TPA: hypothetical protein VGD99_01380, partial [Anaerolineae bacterium]
MLKSGKGENGHGQNGLQWLFGQQPALEEEERRRLEELIQDLLPDEEEDVLGGKVYDARLVRRLLGYMRPYQGQLIVAVILMSVSSLLSVAGP